MVALASPFVSAAASLVPPVMPFILPPLAGVDRPERIVSDLVGNDELTESN
jgi:hypothetical protein